MKTFRLLGYLEGISLLVLLFIAMPLKYRFGEPLYVRYVGWLHGLLFIGYVGFLAIVQGERHWPAKKVFWGFLAAVFPFGTFVFDKKVLAKEAQS